MSKKRVLALVLSLLLSLAMVACSSGTQGANNATPTVSPSTSPAATQASATPSSAGADEKKLSGKVRLLVVGENMEDVTDPNTGAVLEGMDSLVKDFRAQYPDVTIEISAIPWTDWEPKVNTMLMNKQLDVLMLNEPKNWYDKGLIEPIDEYVKNDNLDTNQVWGDLYDSSFINYKGAHIGVPKFVSVKWLMYDKRIFDHYGVEYPKDNEPLESLMEKAAKMTGTDPVTNQKTYGVYLHNARLFTQYLADYFGQPNYTEWATDNPKDIKWNLNSETMVNTLTFYQDFLKYCPPGVSMDKGFENFYTDNNNIAMWINTNQLGPMASYYRNGEMDKISSYGMAVPAVGADGKNGFAASVWQWTLVKDGANKDASWELMKYLSSPDMSLRLYQGRYSIPWGAGVESKVKSDDPFMKTLLKCKSVARSFEPAMLNPAINNEVYQIGLNLASAVENGQTTDIKKLLDTYQDKLTNLTNSMAK